MGNAHNLTAEHFSGPMFERQSDISPEQRMWCAVLIELVRDIQLAYDHFRDAMNGRAKPARERLMKFMDEARSKEIERICDLVGITHSVLIRRCERISEGVDRIDPTNRAHY